MASPVTYLFVVACVLLHLTTTTLSAAPARPKALVIPVSKDTNTLQYILKLNQRNPPVSMPVSIDLKTQLLWTYCTPAYTQSRTPYKCDSTQCSLTNSNCRNTCNMPSKPACNQAGCTQFFVNPFNTKSNTTGELVSDIIRINSTNGSNVGRIVSAPNALFGCARNKVQGLAKNVQGIAGFGKSKSSLPSQLSSSFGFADKFALCLNSDFSTGVVFFGDARPYRLYPGPDDTSTLFSYTPLITNRASPSEYFIGVTSIIVNQTNIPINKSLLTTNQSGIGGTKISTVQPYTVMQTSIYRAVTSVFDENLRKFSPFFQVKRVAAVAPFTFCYDRSTLSFSRIGVIVPDIKLVMQNQQVVWTFFGTNSMVGVNSNVMCLALVDGGVNAKTAIVIGGYQLENNLVEFDLGASRIGFTSSLQYMGFTTCGNFNFTLV